MATKFFYGLLLSAALMFFGCGGDKKEGLKGGGDSIGQGPNTPLAPGLDVAGPEKIGVGPAGPIPVGLPVIDIIEVIARTDPAEPQNERYLEEWEFRVFNIDDDGNQLSPLYFAEADLTGGARIALPNYMYTLPLVIQAFNPVYFIEKDNGKCRNGRGCHDDKKHHDKCDECKLFEIFVPANCYDKAVWMIGPFEDTLWDFYREAAGRSGEAWNPSQVDCFTWLTRTQLLLGTDEIVDALNDLSNTVDQEFSEDAFIDAIQEHQELLVPTRPAICMAERRHNGGGMERGDIVTPDEENEFAFQLDDCKEETPSDLDVSDRDPVFIADSGIVSKICGVRIAQTGQLDVNGETFHPQTTYQLDERDFLGLVHDEPDIKELLDVSIFNVRQTNGLEFDDLKFDDACALTSVIQFTNKDDDERDIFAKTGVTFTDLFDDDRDTKVWLTSDGDRVVDDSDTWAILYPDHKEEEDDDDNGGNGGVNNIGIKGGCKDDDCKDHKHHHHHKKVIAVELLGFREADWRDVLHMTLQPEWTDANSQDTLFVGLRADFELNEEEVDGEQAFLGYTITTWDGTDKDGRRDIRENIANCYNAADIWMRQFFNVDNFQRLEDECCLTEHCKIHSFIDEFLAAEYAVRSQCFSNSRSQQRWQNEEVGLWMMNGHHGVAPNVVINPGWLAPFLEFEIYLQKFDEAVFKGPRAVAFTDEIGQLKVDLPTVVEGDRVMIRAADSCCDDYTLVLPCVPEFVGFAGAPLIPYVPLAIAPPIPPVGPIGPVGPVVPVAPGIPVTPAVSPVPAGAPVTPIADAPKNPDTPKKPESPKDPKEGPGKPDAPKDSDKR